MNKKIIFALSCFLLTNTAFSAAHETRTTKCPDASDITYEMFDKMYNGDYVDFNGISFIMLNREMVAAPAFYNQSTKTNWRTRVKQTGIESTGKNIKCHYSFTTGLGKKGGGIGFNAYKFTISPLVSEPTFVSRLSEQPTPDRSSRSPDRDSYSISSDDTYSSHSRSPSPSPSRHRHDGHSEASSSSASSYGSPPRKSNSSSDLLADEAIQRAFNQHKEKIATLKKHDSAPELGKHQPDILNKRLEEASKGPARSARGSVAASER